MSRKVKWACPRCGATPAGCKGAKKTIPLVEGHHLNTCMGFICECTHEIGENHGEDISDACHHALCYHCGWGGTFPPLLFKLTGWAKKAWDAGWRPPAGWQP